MAVALKSPEQIDALAQAASLAWRIVLAVAASARPGLTTAHLAAIAEQAILDANAEPIFKGYGAGEGRSPFPAAACISLNEEALHGVPGDRTIALGDTLKVDLGLRFGGWCADAATTVIVGSDDHRTPAPLVQACRDALNLALSMLTPGQRWSQVAAAVGALARECGAALIAGYDGHGIGRKLHEPPRTPLVLGVSGRAPADEDFVLWPGMVFTVEPAMTLGRPEVREADNRWTVCTADGSPAAHEERMVAITRAAPRLLCGDPSTFNG